MKKMKIKNHRKKEMKNKINGNRRNKNEKNATTYTSSLMFALQVPCWLLLLLHGPSCSLLLAPQETWWPPIPTERTWWPNTIQEPWSAGDTMLTGRTRWFTMFVCSTRMRWCCEMRVWLVGYDGLRSMAMLEDMGCLELVMAWSIGCRVQRIYLGGP